MRMLKGLTIVNVMIVLTTTCAWSEDLDVGKVEYLSSCAACHGPDGKGKGPLSGELRTAPADLTIIAKENDGVFPVKEVYEIIDGSKSVRVHGTREMPIWGFRYTPSPNQPESLRPNPPYTQDRGAFPPPPSNPPYYLNPSYDPGVLVRNRVLAIIDYLNRIQQK